MIVEKTSWGRIVTIPETEFNSEFTYHLREVRKINNNEPKEQKLISELEKNEQKDIRKFLLLVFSMENTFIRLGKEYDDGNSKVYENWEYKNRLDFNEYYHSQINDLHEKINNYSFEYADRSEHGWCL